MMDVTISLPEKQFIADSPERTAAKIKLYAALGLYQAGELSLGVPQKQIVERHLGYGTTKSLSCYIRTRRLREQTEISKP